MSREVELRTKANLARSGLHDLSPYEDADTGWYDPMDDPEIRAALRDLCARLWRNPSDPYGQAT